MVKIRHPRGAGGPFRKKTFKSGMKKGLMEIKDRRGQQVAVFNPRGKGSVNIVVTSLPGFTVRMTKPPFRIISSGHRNAETLAFRLARKGKRQVNQMF